MRLALGNAFWAYCRVIGHAEVTVRVAAEKCHVAVGAWLDLRCLVFKSKSLISPSAEAREPLDGCA
jgi:hypothetical protein